MNAGLQSRDKGKPCGQHQVSKETDSDQREGGSAQQSVKSAPRTHVHKFRGAADTGCTDKAQDLARVACRAFGKAVSKGVIHANQAANRLLGEQRLWPR